MFIAQKMYNNDTIKIFYFLF